MNLHTLDRWGATWTLAATLWVVAAVCQVAPAAVATDDTDTAADSSPQAAAKDRDKDPAWRPSHREIGSIRVGEGKKTGSLSNFCVAKDGNVLACWSGENPDAPRAKKPAAAANEIRVCSPAGKFLKTIPLPVAPGAICVDQEGNILVGGGGRLLKLDPQGKVLLAADTPTAKLPVALSKEMQEMLKEGGGSNKQQVAAYKKQLEARRGEVTGLAVTAQDVFVACPSATDFGYCVYRLDLQLANPKLVADKLRGCCGQMDVQARDDKLWIPHNARHRVECRDREGKELSNFGKEGRTKPEQFGGCCEPKNLRLTATGEILAAESGPPTCIKKFSPDGKFLGVVALLKGDGNCVRVSVDVSPDGQQFYLLDTEHNAIRIFGPQPGEAQRAGIP